MDPGYQGNTLLMRLVGTNFVVYPVSDDVSFDDLLDQIQKDMEKFSEKLGYTHSCTQFNFMYMVILSIHDITKHVAQLM